MFNVDKGMIHIAFMNEDTYVKKSLITLNRQMNLYYELKKAGCKAVFQITLNNQGYCLTCLDAAAKEIYRELIPEKKSFFSKLVQYMGDSAGHADQRNRTVFVFDKENRKGLFDVLSEIMNHKKNNAFVFSMDAMYSFQQNKKIVDFFLEQLNRNHERRNLIVVESEASCEASFEMLTDENGFFQTDVFPIIRKVCQQYENPRLYERLCIEMKDQIEFFNVMAREELKNLVTLEIMKKPDDEGAFEIIDDYTDFIWLAIHSASFYEQIVTQNKRMECLGRAERHYCEIKKLLETEDFCAEMEKLIAVLRKKAEMHQSLIDFANRTDTALTDQQFISWNNPILNKLDEIIQQQRTDTQARIIRNRLRKLKNESRKPFFAADKEKQEKVNNAMDDYLNVAISSSQLGDTERLELALDAMEFCIFECSKPRYTATIETSRKDSYLAVLEYYGQALNEEEAIFEQKKLQKKYQDSLQKSYENQWENQKLLDQLLKDYNLEETEITNSANPAAAKCLSLKKNLIDTQKNITVIKELLKAVDMNLNSHVHTIDVIKTTITTIKNAEYSYSSSQLNTCFEIISKSLADAKENQREYEYTMEALQNSMQTGELEYDLLSSLQDDDELCTLVNKN